LVVGAKWIEGTKLNWKAGDIDFKILSLLQKRYEEVRDVTGTFRDSLKKNFVSSIASIALNFIIFSL